MLVLSRKVGDKIRINDNITVTVLKCQGSTVRIGIEAPAEVKILRAELPPLPPADQELASTTPRTPIRVVRPALHRQKSVACDSHGSPQSPSPTVTAQAPGRAVVGTGHPQRWSVANMRERAQSALAGRNVAKRSTSPDR